MHHIHIYIYMRATIYRYHTEIYNNLSILKFAFPEILFCFTEFIHLLSLRIDNIQCNIHRNRNGSRQRKWRWLLPSLNSQNYHSSKSLSVNLKELGLKPIKLYWSAAFTTDKLCNSEEITLPP